MWPLLTRWPSQNSSVPDSGILPFPFLHRLLNVRDIRIRINTILSSFSFWEYTRLARRSQFRAKSVEIKHKRPVPSLALLLHLWVVTQQTIRSKTCG